MPYATTSNLEINAVQVGLFFIVIAYLSQFIQTQKNKWCFYSLIAILIGMSIRTYDHVKKDRQTTLTVWFVPKKSQITTRYGPGPEQPLQVNNTAFSIGHTRFLHIGQTAQLNNSIREASKVDILLISNRSKSPISLLAKHFTRALYVFDSSIPLWKMESWKKEAEGLHLRHHFVSQQGAFVHQSSNGKEN